MSDPSSLHLAELVADRQHGRLLRLSFPQGGEPAGGDLVVNTLSASEGLSCDFDFKAELLSSNADLALKDLQGKMLCVELVRPDGTLRYFTGIVFEFRLMRTDGNLAFYEARLGPWIKCLRLRANNRLFHRQTLRAQTEAIFGDYGVLPKWEWLVRGEDTPHTMAVQGGGAAGETDHNYLHRRWEAAGYSYWYEHSAEGHTLHVCDDSTPAKALDGSSSEIRFQGEGGAQEEDGIGQWSAVRELVSAQAAVSAFDFKNSRPQHAAMPSNNQQGDVPQLEAHEYGGARHFKTSLQGEGVARRRIGEIEAKAKRFEAQGNNRFVLPGRWFRLADHFGRTQGESSESEFLVLSVEHRASNNYLQEPVTGEGKPKGARAEYRNSFVCSRRFVPWRPGRGFHSEEQRVMAPQTATVVGPSAEGSIHTDEYGRIRVQFHWDREGHLQAGRLDRVSVHRLHLHRVRFRGHFHLWVHVFQLHLLAVTVPAKSAQCLSVQQLPVERLEFRWGSLVRCRGAWMHGHHSSGRWSARRACGLHRQLLRAHGNAQRANQLSSTSGAIFRSIHAKRHSQPQSHVWNLRL